MAATMKKPTSPVTVVLKERRWLTDDTFVLRCTRPQGFEFVAGQHVALQAGGEERYYTIVSAEQANQLHFLIKRIDQGVVSAALANLPIGHGILMGMPKGYLVRRPTARTRVFVATGTGIAPFVSMIKSGVSAAYLLHGARKVRELYYQQTFLGSVSCYIRCLSAVTDLESSKSVYRGRVTRYIHDELPAGQYDFYLCGKWEMIREATHAIDRRFPEANIYSEGFD